MIEIYTEYFSGIETLHAVPAGKRDCALPTVIFYHGFLSSKQVYSYFAVALAQAGIRTIMPDAPAHGMRFDGDAAMRLRSFWSILKRNIDEYPFLYQALCAEKCIVKERLAVGGASMGAMSALGIMAQHPQIRCGASLMGSGYFLTLAQKLFPPSQRDTPEARRYFAEALAPLKDYDLSNHPERVGDRPLLLWHGEEDDVVPAEETRRLQQALGVQQLDKQLTCLWEPGVKHRITPMALEATVDFFNKNL